MDTEQVLGREETAMKRQAVWIVIIIIIICITVICLRIGISLYSGLIELGFYKEGCVGMYWGWRL